MLGVFLFFNYYFTLRKGLLSCVCLGLDFFSFGAIYILRENFTSKHTHHKLGTGSSGASGGAPVNPILQNIRDMGFEVSEEEFVEVSLSLVLF